MSGERLYLTHQRLIERILNFVARRHRCDPDEAEDFAAWARLKLVDNDAAILAAYQGRADMWSYLVVVVQRLFLDYRNAKWGSWRPSAEAKRLGPLAIKLETLTVRDGASLEDAYRTLRAADPGLRREVVEDLRARLPLRLPPRRFEGEDALQTLSAPGAQPDELLIEEETAARKQQAAAVAMELMRRLEPQEQLILRLRFAEQLQIVEVAQTLHLEARPLYRRIERLLAGLRRGLEEHGLRAEDLGWGTSERSSTATPRRQHSGSPAQEAGAHDRLQGG